MLTAYESKTQTLTPQVQNGVASEAYNPETTRAALWEACANQQYESQISLLRKIAVHHLKLQDYASATKVLNACLILLQKHADAIPQSVALKETILQHLVDIEIQFIKSELQNNKISKIKTQDLKNRLKEIREKTKKEIGAIQDVKGLPDPQYVQAIQTIFKETTLLINLLVQDILEDCLSLMLSKPPCEFAFIGTGSLAREEITPFSDLECFLLIAQDKENYKEYFKKLCQLFELKIINFGETKLTDPNFFPPEILECIPKGFSLDIHKNPMEKQYELIGTPEKLASYQLPESYVHLTGNHLSSALVNTVFIFGSAQGESLLNSYRKMLGNDRERATKVGTGLSQLFDILKMDNARFKPNLENSSAGYALKVKEDLYRLPHIVIESLALQCGIESCSSWNRIQELIKRNVLLPVAGQRISAVLSLIQILRLKTYYKYDAQKEMLDILETIINNKDTNNFIHIYQVLIPLFRCAALFFQDKDIRHFITAPLYDEDPLVLGDICVRLCAYEQARAHYLKALSDLKEGTPANQKMKILSRLAFTHYHLEQMQDAKKITLEIMELKKVELQDPLHIDMACHYNNLSNILLEISEIEECIAYGEKVLKIAANAKPGPNLYFYQILSRTIRVLGYAYSRMGDNKKAIYFFEQGLKAHLSYYGEDPEAASLYNHLAAIYLNQKNTTSAERYFIKSLNIYETYCGGMHPNVALACNNLALLYSRLREHESAARFLKRSLFIDSSIFGNEHPLVATRLNNIGTTYYEIEDYAKALKHFQDALNINLKAYGEIHAHVAGGYGNIGNIYMQMEKFDEALDHFNKALRTFQALKDDLEVASCYKDFGCLYLHSNNFEMAFEYFEKTYELHCKLRTPDHPDIADDLNNLGGAWREKARVDNKKESLENALAYFNQAMVIVKSWDDRDKLKIAIQDNLDKATKALQSLSNNPPENRPHIKPG